MSERLKIYVALVMLCLLVYANSLTGSFVSDDIPAIQENPHIGELSRFWSDPTSVINSFIYRISGTSPILYHLASIILHSINAILVFVFLSIFFKAASSFLGACVFAAHPVNVEAVAWISGRPYQWTGFFCLVCLLLYYRATIPLLVGKKIDLERYLLALAAFVYFLYQNYPFFLTFPALLMLFDISFGKWRVTYRWWLAFIVISLFRIAFVGDELSGRIEYIIAEGGPIVVANDPLKYFLHSLSGHFKLLVWPAILTLYHNSPYLSFPNRALNIFYCILIATFLIVVFRKSRRLFFGMGIFVIFLIPTYSPIPLSNLVAERYLYFPSLALSIWLALFWEQYTGRFPAQKKIALALSIAIVAALAVRTVIRNKDWKSQENFWRTTAKLAPNDPKALNNMGAAYLTAGRIEQARETLVKAIRQAPNMASAYNNLGIAYRRLGRIPQAIDSFKQAIRINLRFTDAYNNLAVAYRQDGDLQKALESCKKAIEINPKFIKAYFNLGDTYERLGKKEDAVAAYEQALRIAKAPQEAYERLAGLYLAAGENKKAIVLLKQMTASNPRDGRAYFALGIAHLRENESMQANAYFAKAKTLGVGSVSERAPELGQFSIPAKAK